MNKRARSNCSSCSSQMSYLGQLKSLYHGGHTMPAAYALFHIQRKLDIILGHAAFILLFFKSRLFNEPCPAGCLPQHRIVKKMRHGSTIIEFHFPYSTFECISFLAFSINNRGTLIQGLHPQCLSYTDNGSFCLISTYTHTKIYFSYQ